ncbi:MAG: NAD(P)H-hydrate dehydratase [Verrucomicrobiota bacterium]
MIAHANAPLPYAHPILSPQESGGLEERLLGGNEDKEWSAMQAAGRAVGIAVGWDSWELSTPIGHRVLVLAGKGHNGGDALLAAEELLSQWEDAEAVIIAMGAVDEMKPLTRRAYDLLMETDAVVEVIEIFSKEDVRELFERRPGFFAEVEVVLDGLVGFQFKPPLREPMQTLIRALNRTPGIGLRAAVDLPSGVGSESDPEPFRADFTYATGIVKAPLIDAGNQQWVGRVRYCDIGFFNTPLAGEFDSDRLVLTPEVLAPLRALRPPESDKRDYGHPVILGGSRAMPGALLMAALAAVRSGAGLTTVLAPESLLPAFPAQLPEAMWTGLPETPGGGIALEAQRLIEQQLERATALLIGPGMGREPETRRLIAELAKSVNLPLALDADALHPEVIDALRERPSDFPPAVLTPHAGEYQRIAGDQPPQDFARELHAVLILKGSPSYITDGRKLCVSLVGGPVLARGGSGDLLAGMLVTQLAQERDDTLAQACRAVYWHGSAADTLAQRQGQTAARSTDLLNYLALGPQSPM